MVGVEQWAEVRRMKRVEGLSAREISRRTGLARDTVSRLLAAEEPPAYSRAPAGSILDPFKDWICEQLQADPTVPSQRLRELAVEIGYAGGKTIFDDVRPGGPAPVLGHAHVSADDLSAGGVDPVRSLGAERARPGRLGSDPSWLCRDLVSRVGRGRSRARWSSARRRRTSSRAWPGTCTRLGVRAEKLVWDRESAIAGRGKPTEAFLAFCGQLQVGWIILDAGDPQAKGQLERQHRLSGEELRAAAVASRTTSTSRTSSTAGLRRPTAVSTARSARSRPSGSRTSASCGRSGAVRVDTDRRWVIRVPQQPLVRVDRNDYSIDPVFAGRRVEVRVSQTRDHGDRVWTPVSSPPATVGSSPGIRRSSTPRTRTASRSSASAAANATRSMSSSGRCRSMTR